MIPCSLTKWTPKATHSGSTYTWRQATPGISISTLACGLGAAFVVALRLFMMHTASYNRWPKKGVGSLVNIGVPC